MEICITGKFEPGNNYLYTPEDISQISWVGEGFVFVQYLAEDIFVGDVFVLEDGTEITLKEIKLQFETKEPFTMMSRGWKCLCRFDNLRLEKMPVAKDWFDSTSDIIAKRKTQ